VGSVRSPECSLEGCRRRGRVLSTTLAAARALGGEDAAEDTVVPVKVGSGTGRREDGVLGTRWEGFGFDGDVILDVAGVVVEGIVKQPSVTLWYSSRCSLAT
jgi:hypothetical protein